MYVCILSVQAVKMSRRLEKEIRDINRKGNVYYVVEGNWDDEEKMSFTVRMAVPNSKLNATVNVKVPKMYPIQPPHLRTMEVRLYDLSYVLVEGSYAKQRSQITEPLLRAKLVTQKEYHELFRLFDYYTTGCEEKQKEYERLRDTESELSTRARTLEAERQAIGDSRRPDWQRLDEEVFSIYDRQKVIGVQIASLLPTGCGYDLSLRLPYIIEIFILPIVTFYTRLFEKGKAAEEYCPNEKVEEITTKRSPDGYTRFKKYKMKANGRCGYYAFARWMKKYRRTEYEAIRAEQSGDEPLRRWLQAYILFIGSGNDRANQTEKGRQESCLRSSVGYEELPDILARAKKRLRGTDRAWMGTDELFFLCCYFRVRAYIYLRTRSLNKNSGQYEEVALWEPTNPQKVEGRENTIHLFNNGSHFDLIIPEEARSRSSLKL